MLRYIKVKGRWIDTLMDQKEWGRIYFVVDNIVWYYWDEDGRVYRVGRLQDESDTLVNEKLGGYELCYTKESI